MKSVHFGEPSHALFGAFEPPQVGASSTAVLLCNPFGEEAVRAHRIYRVLATQLARAGHAVLRFDWFATGDSAGDSTEATLERWLDDAALAAAELRRQSGAPKLAVLGLRLGGTLAALSSATVRPDHLLLWDPVVDGAEYLRELAHAHAEYLTEEFGEPRNGPALSAAGFPVEALGHPLPDALATALARVDLSRASIEAPAITLLSTNAAPAMRRLEASLPRAHSITATSSVPWNSDAAMNSAVVPMDVLKLLMGRIQEAAR